tara:strand:+ start:78 stop:233 length:156 start_codon:yes stop_codon:yes gene_type:complete
MIIRLQHVSALIVIKEKKRTRLLQVLGIIAFQNIEDVEIALQCLIKKGVRD